jgi:phenylacetate-CoA ligase
MSAWDERIYPYLPVAAQNVACSLVGARQRRLRYGGEFRRLLDWMEAAQWWSADRIAGYQDEQLQAMVRHAYEHVPYYRRVFDSRRLKPQDIRGRADLAKIPILAKEDVRHHRDELVASGVPRRDLVFCHTSGSTGKSLQFYMEPRAVQFQWAVWWRHRQRFGVSPGMPHASFLGRAAVPLRQSRPPYWRENWPMRQTLFSIHHLVPGKAGAIVGRLNQGGFDFYAGFPTVLGVLAELALEQGLKIVAPPRAVFTGADSLRAPQRQAMQQVFQSIVTDQYGFAEGCGNASRCPQDVFHEDFEYGILECADPEAVGPGLKRGRIVATGFASLAMPFIRYDVGDVGLWSEEPCACGRKSPVLVDIEGRVEDYVVTPEGRRIMRLDYIFKDAQNVREAQVMQREPGGIWLRIVRRPGYSTRDEEVLRREVRDRISASLKVEFEYVNEIERLPGGKVQAVKSLLRQRDTTRRSE